MGEHTPQGQLKAELGGLIFDAESRCIAATSNSKIDVASRIAACWNACAGFDTEMLEGIVTGGETILQRVMGNTTEIRRVNKELAMMKNERDMLLLELKNSSGALEAFADISITVRQQLKENNTVLAKTTEDKS